MKKCANCKEDLFISWDYSEEEGGFPEICDICFTNCMIKTSWAYAKEAKSCSKNNKRMLEILISNIGKDSYEIKVSHEHNRIKYELTPLTEKAKKLTGLQAALIADGGSLCFGGQFKEYNKNINLFTGFIYND
jgi:hypothetical protein